MSKVSKLIACVLACTVAMSLLTASVFAVENKSFVVEFAAGLTGHFTVTNLIESREGGNGQPRPDFSLKAQAPAKIICDQLIVSEIEISYENKVYSNVSGEPISSIAKETGKVAIPDGPVMPAHYDWGYTVELDKPGHYSIRTSYSDYDLHLSVDVVEGSSDDRQQDGNTALAADVPVSPAAVASALPNASKILVNGNEVTLEAYTINDNNYFKLRDIAAVVNQTGKQFAVVWDDNLQTINLASHTPYTVVGGELKAGDGHAKQGTLNTSPIYKDGQLTQLTAYTINGNNFFKLRDLAKAFDMGVTWDGTASTVGIDTTIPYAQ